MNIRVQTNASSVIANMGRFSENIIDDVDKKFIQAGALMTTNAKMLSLVDTGNLRRNIGFRRVGRLHVEVFSVASYSAYIEYGTGKFAKFGNGRMSGWYYPTRNGGFAYTEGQPAKPFFFPSYELAIKWLRGVL
jgi:hypothetical protein